MHLWRPWLPGGRVKAPANAYLVLALRAGPSQSGHDRNALVAIDAETGALAGVERYDETTTAEAALDRLMRRECFDEGDVTIGPELTVPARELFRLVEEAKARARRNRTAAEARQKARIA